MSPVDFNYPKKRRDRRLRRKIVECLYITRGTSPTGEIGATSLRDLVDSTTPGDQRFENDQHALQLIADLEEKGLLAKRVRGLVRGGGYGLANVTLKITARGVSLKEQTIDPDPDVDDDRNLEE